MDTIFLQKPTERLHLHEGQLIHRDGEEVLEVYPLASTEQVLVYGNSQITTQALKECLKEGIRVLYFTAYGKYLGRLEPDYPKNICRRIKQYKLSLDAERNLQWSRSLLLSKIQGDIIELRRLHEQGYDIPYKQLRNTMKKNQELIKSAGSVEELRGYEGKNAKEYFDIFSKVIPSWCIWHGRRSHPSEGLVNILLSLTYGCCAVELRKLCEHHSLDPHCGFLHKPGYNGGGLPYDLLEPVRGTICDHFVIMLLHSRTFGKELEHIRDVNAEDIPGELRTCICREFVQSLSIRHGKQRETPLDHLRHLLQETVHGLEDEDHIPDYVRIHPER